MAEIDLISEHFSITDDEIMEAINTGESKKFDLRSVGNGKNFRGYVISDSETGVRIADYIYSHSNKSFELRKRPGYEKEIAIAREKMRQDKKEQRKQEKKKQYALKRVKTVKHLSAGAIAAILMFTGVKVGENMAQAENVNPNPERPAVQFEQSGLRTCDYRLCTRYIDYSLSYIDDLLGKYDKPEAINMVIRNRDALRTGYANAAYSANADIDDYREMGGFESAIEKSKEKVRECTIEFEDQFLALFPNGKSFADSPLNGAVVINTVTDDGRKIEQVYIPESVNNYTDGKVPETSFVKDGIVYVPLKDSARYMGSKVK